MVGVHHSGQRVYQDKSLTALAREALLRDERDGLDPLVIAFNKSQLTWQILY
jgi:hypothetical protein